MAKVTLIIEDCEDGVKLTLESDPPFDMDDDGESTDAQYAGLIAMRAIQDTGSADDLLHPNGRCKCGGEGKCEWCNQCDDCAESQVGPER